MLSGSACVHLMDVMSVLVCVCVRHSGMKAVLSQVIIVH